MLRTYITSGILLLKMHNLNLNLKEMSILEESIKYLANRLQKHQNHESQRRPVQQSQCGEDQRDADHGSENGL